MFKPMIDHCQNRNKILSQELEKKRNEYHRLLGEQQEIETQVNNTLNVIDSLASMIKENNISIQQAQILSKGKKKEKPLVIPTKTEIVTQKLKEKKIVDV